MRRDERCLSEAEGEGNDADDDDAMKCEFVEDVLLPTLDENEGLGATETGVWKKRASCTSVVSSSPGMISSFAGFIFWTRACMVRRSFRGWGVEGVGEGIWEGILGGGL